MKVFWIRFTIFSVIWLCLITIESNSIPFHLVCFSIVLALFFMLSFQKREFLLYTMMMIVVSISASTGMDGMVFSFVLLWFLILDATYRLTVKAYYWLISIMLCSGIWIMAIQQSFNFILVVSTVFIVICGFLMLKGIQRKKHYQDLYDQLLSEYRKLKRLNLTAENNARLEERTKIARDMHDSVGHRLTALIMQLEMLDIQQPDLELNNLKEMAKESLEETRHAVKTLQMEETEGLASVVHLIRKLEAESHMTVQFTLKRGILSIPITNEKSVILYRIIQEAITNAMRHANSREINVIISKSADEALTFEITNAVFQPKPFQLGFGLRNMKERVREIDGILEVYQLEDRFVVSGRIPIKLNE